MMLAGAGRGGAGSLPRYQSLSDSSDTSKQTP